MPTLREPNGKRQRPSKPERELSVKAVVLAQPHRRTDERHGDDPDRESPFGRMLLDGKVRFPGLTPITLRCAAESYSAAWRRYRRVLDSGRPLAIAGGPAGYDMSLQERMKIESDWGDVCRALRDAGVMSQKAVEYVLQDALPTDDETVYSPWLIRGLSVGLAHLAKHFGFVR